MTRRATLTAEHLTETPTAVQLLRIDGHLRLFLTPREVADLCGVHYELVLAWIHGGLISTAKEALGCGHYPIPVSELSKLVGLAKPA